MYCTSGLAIELFIGILNTHHPKNDHGIEISTLIQETHLSTNHLRNRKVGNAQHAQLADQQWTGVLPAAAARGAEISTRSTKSDRASCIALLSVPDPNL